jgi:hypothetical protein
MAIHPTCIYGFNEGNINYILDSSILEEFDINYYISEINTKSLSEIIYGIECQFDQLTGQIFIHENKKKIVDELFNKVMEYKNNHNNNDFMVPELGYYICLTGEGINYDYYTHYSIN